ncbi:MAG: YitT family protein [Oscillospiraceae bacterium]|nr:YitT family protein [Oscillospiraceae bacterium]
MKKAWKYIPMVAKILLGCALFGLGFNLFLVPNGLNAGGISGLSMLFVRLTNIGTIGLVTAIVNLPLFALGGLKIGKKFFFGSLFGMLLSSTFIDVFSALPIPETEPLVGAIYGGVLCGLGGGLVFSQGASTGGSDIIVRLLKLKWQNVPIGTITMTFDLAVVALTGLVFRNIGVSLYSGVAIYITGQIIDAVVYRFDYSKVALIVSREHDRIAACIAHKLERGVTFLEGEGYYTGNQTKVVLTAVKKQQLAELKKLVAEIDPDAFIIVQEAHQVLGDGFSRYSRESL